MYATVTSELKILDEEALQRAAIENEMKFPEND